MSGLDQVIRGRARLDLAKISAAGPNVGLPVALVGLCIALTLLLNVFFTLDNALNIGRASAYTGISAAVTTLVLVGGGLDLSIGAVMALVSVVAARLLSAGAPLVVVLVVCLVVGLGVGLVNGVVVTFLGVNPFITTIGTQFIVELHMRCR